MPLHLYHSNSEGKLQTTPLPLHGEMSEHDFSGPSKCDWYYAAFENNPQNAEDPDLNIYKQQLADWINTCGDANVTGPYYIHEDDDYGHGGSLRNTLCIVLLDPADILRFQKAWGSDFRFNADDVKKNIQMDIERADSGFVPDHTGLKNIYNAYAWLNVKHRSAEEKVAVFKKVLGFAMKPHNIAAQTPNLE